MRPLALICLPLLAGCETRRYPTTAELFEGQAIVSFIAETSFPTVQRHLKERAPPMNEAVSFCQAPTTDSVVAAVNDFVRTGTPVNADDVGYTREVLPAPDLYIPAGIHLTDAAGTLLIDTQGRIVTVGEISRDFDGNYFELPDEDYDEVSTIDRLIDIDSVWRKCEEQWSVFRSLPPL